MGNKIISTGKCRTASYLQGKNWEHFISKSQPKLRKDNGGLKMPGLGVTVRGAAKNTASVPGAGRLPPRALPEEAHSVLTTTL